MIATIKVGEKVEHRKYGVGEVFKVEIIDGSSCTLHVKFESGEKAFHYPTIIKNDLVFGDFETQIHAKWDLADYEEEIKHSALVNPLKLFLLEDEREREAFFEMLDTLTPSEKSVLTMFFCLEGETPKSFSEIGDCLGEDVQWVRKLFARALRKLRNQRRARNIPQTIRLLTPKEKERI